MHLSLIHFPQQIQDALLIASHSFEYARCMLTKIVNQCLTIIVRCLTNIVNLCLTNVVNLCLTNFVKLCLTTIVKLVKFVKHNFTHRLFGVWVLLMWVMLIQDNVSLNYNPLYQGKTLWFQPCRLCTWVLMMPKISPVSRTVLERS